MPRHLFLLSLAVFLTLASASQAMQSVTGKVTKVRDADTIVVQGVPVRLNGIDAPENSTRAGRDATAAMQRYLRGRTVRCELNGDRTYDRWVGTCFSEDGRDIGAVMISAGHALDCRRYSGGRYRSFEPAGARSRLSQATYC